MKRNYSKRKKPKQSQTRPNRCPQAINSLGRILLPDCRTKRMEEDDAESRKYAWVGTLYNKLEQEPELTSFPTIPDSTGKNRKLPSASNRSAEQVG